MTISCPFCIGTKSELRFTVPLDCKTFQPTTFGSIYECRSCSAGFVYPRPTSAQTNAFYELDSYYTQGKSHMPDTGVPSFVSKVRTHLAWRADNGQSLPDVIAKRLVAESSVVDIGCGDGLLLQLLGDWGYKMIGVERDASTVSRKSANVRVLEGSAEQLPSDLHRGSHDGVVFSHVMEHLVNPIQAIRTAASLLKPGGLMFVEVPNNASMIAKQSGPTWEHLDAPRHINFFCEQSMRELMKSSGMNVIDVYFSGYNRYFYDEFIATEQRIYDEFVKSGWKPSKAARNSVPRSWGLLAKTAFAAAPRKYDSIGVVASLQP